MMPVIARAGSRTRQGSTRTGHPGNPDRGNPARAARQRCPEGTAFPGCPEIGKAVGSVNEVEGLREALRLQVETVRHIGDKDLQAPSRSCGWSIGQVLQHSLGVTRKFTDFAAGRTNRPHAPTGDLLTPDHRSAFERAAMNADEAWRRTDMTRACHLAFGTFSASAAAGINLFDVLAHTWDVAEPIRLSFPCPDELWDAGLRAAKGVIGSNRDPTHYGPRLSTSVDAGPRERFLAYLGRAQERTTD